MNRACRHRCLGLTRQFQSDVVKTGVTACPRTGWPLDTDDLDSAKPLRGNLSGQLARVMLTRAAISVAVTFCFAIPGIEVLGIEGPIGPWARLDPALNQHALETARAAETSPGASIHMLASARSQGTASLD